MHGLTNSISAVVDDNVLCNAHDPHHHMENILVHEFGHQIYNYMPSEYRNKVMSRTIFIIRSDLSIVKLNINYRYWVDTSTGVQYTRIQGGGGGAMGASAPPPPSNMSCIYINIRFSRLVNVTIWLLIEWFRFV